MTENDPSDDTKVDFRLSRFMRLSTAIALGSLATVGLGVYLLVGPVLKNLGSQTLLAYVLTVIFFIPVILVLAERAAVIRGRGGIFNLARSGNVVWLSYWTGWLLLSGYFCLIALFAWGAGQVLNTALLDFAELEVDYRLLAALTVVLVVLLRLIRSESAWNFKSGIIYASILVSFLLTLRLWVIPVRSVPPSAFLPTQDSISAVPFLAVGMWGLSFILDHRDEMRRPRRRMLAALSLPVLLSGFIGLVTAAILLQYPGVVASTDQPLFVLVAEIGPVADGILLLATFGLALIGINQGLESTGRLTEEMVGSGFVHKRLLSMKGKIQPYLTIAIPIIAIVMVVFLTESMIAGGAASMLLLAIALTVGQDIFMRNPYLPDKRRLVLPLHPLFPAMAAVISLTMAFAQPVENHIILFVWAVLGFFYYNVYGRRGAVEARQRAAVVTGESFDHEKVANAVLVYVPDVNQAQPLLRAGAILARTRQAPILVLQVVETAGASSQVDEQSETQLATSIFDYLLDNDQQLEEIQVTPLVRLAPTAYEGIMATIWDEQVATTLVSWSEGDDKATGLPLEEVSHLVRRAPCEVVAVQGEFPSSLKDVLVPMTSVSHNRAALALARDLVKDSGGRVRALGILRGRASDEAKSKAYGAIRSKVVQLGDTTGIEIEIVEVVGAQEDLYHVFGHYDLLILGASEEGFLRPTTIVGFPADTVAGDEHAGMVVKKRERIGALWLRQMWETLFQILPKVNHKDRVSIYRSMQRNARADIDFYVLIILAAGIAYLGLLLNSSSVIIGAMLIAPLMSPILSTAHGIVMGNQPMTRSAGNSTLRGVVMAISVAFFLSLFLFALGSPLDPTSEILSRTSPNVLDLLVALLSGGAAAYAVSRSQLAAALPGVAIAAALVPPLCVVGYGLGTGQFEIAIGSSLLFLTNLAAIVVAAAAIFILLGFRPPLRLERGEQARQGLIVALVSLLAVAIILVVVSAVTNNQAKEVAMIESMVLSSVPSDDGDVIDLEIDRRFRLYVVNYKVVDYTGEYGEADVDALQRAIDSEVSESVLLQASILRGSLTFSDGSERIQPTETPTPSPTVMEGAPVFPTSDVTATQTLAPTQTVAPITTLTPLSTETPVPEGTPTGEPTEEPPVVRPTPVSTPTEAAVTETPPPTETLPPTETPQPTKEPTSTMEVTEEPTPTIETTGAPPESPTPTEESTTEPAGG